MTANSTSFFDTTRISVFKDVRSTEPATATLRQFLFSQKHTPKIIALRAIPDKPGRDEVKKTLPAATISGTFTRRAAGHITHYNGLVCLDFDAAENPGQSPEQMKATLARFDEVAYAAVSVGGAGVFAVIPTNNTDPARHAELVDLLGAVIATHGLTYDRACKDVCRLRVVSFDPTAHINPAPAIFDADRLFQLRNEGEQYRPPRPLVLRATPLHRRGAGGEADRTRDRVEAVIAAAESTRTDVTDDYQDWLRLGFAIANHFGAAGEDYYQRLSQFHHKYDHHETAKKYAEYVRNGKRVRIGTFFKIMENHGISL